ncbi:MAG: HYR domain-containing protein, partial [Bacteroidales bacterium]|nr:HYR domain-containing protein [Bacteroidales bacterium]
MKKYYKPSLIFLLMALIIYPQWSFASGDDPKPKSSIHDLSLTSDVVIPDLLPFYLHNNFAPDDDKEPAKDTIIHKPGHGRDVIEGYVGWAGNPDSLDVYIDTTWTDAEKDSCRAAMARWNDAGCVPKFRETSSAADADITITQGDPGEGAAGLYSWNTDEDGKVTGGTITIAEDTSPLSLMEVLTHELGHAIGLDDTDPAANAGDVMRGSGPSNGTDGNLSQHDSTEMHQAAEAITAVAEAPKERRRAISPEQALLPGQFEELIFPLSDFYPPSMPLTVAPIADDQLFVEYFFINGNQLHVGLFTDPLHGSGKLYLDVVLFPPFGEPIAFWGVHFINSNPVPPVEFSCPFEAIQVGDRVQVNWVDFCDYPFTNPLRSRLIVDGNTYYEVKPTGDYTIELEPGLHQLHLQVDDYQVNRTDSFFDVYVTPNSVPWEDGFEDYAVGDDIVGQGGWEFWFGAPSSFGAFVTDEQAQSGGQSLHIMGAEDPALADDILHQFSGCNSGVWKFTAWQFIPLSAAGGTTYITLLDQYGNDIDECHWATQIKFDPDLGTVESDYDGATLPLLKGQWAEIDVVIDFDNDWQTIYYNGQLLTEKSWTLGVPQEAPGILNLAAIDLFANTLNTPVYYDDFVITDVSGNYPTVVCPPDITLSNDPGMCGAAGVDLGVPEIINPDGTEVISNDAPNAFPIGVTTVVWTVTNSGGYTVSCEQIVTVVDMEEPQFSPMADLEVSNESGECGAGVDWDWPEATDNCGIESLTGNYEPGTFFPVGLTEVVYTATDVNGNQAYAGFTVAVLDTEEPQFQPEMPDLEVPNDPGVCGAAITWEWPIATDNCGIESLSGNHEPGEVFPVGLTDVVYTATDSYGNQAYAGFTVAVLGTEEPKFQP